MPTISIIIPSYKSRNFIRATLDSIIAQTYSDWECIIVDDHSPDGSVDFVKSIIKDDSRFKLIALSRNRGASNARNVAMRAATGRYFAFIDADDLWEPSKLEIQLKAMEDSGVPFSYTAYHVIDNDGSLVVDNQSVPASLNLKEFLSNTAIATSSVLVESRLCAHGFCPGPLFRSEDAIYWIKIFRQGHTAIGIRKPLLSYRLTAGSLSRNKFRSFSAFWFISMKYSKFPCPIKLLHFSLYMIRAVVKHSKFYLLKKSHRSTSGL